MDYFLTRVKQGAHTQVSNLLIQDYPLIILPALAAKIGLNEAIILQQIHYWTSNGRGHSRDGVMWHYDTYEAWKKQFPFWSISTIKRIVESLRKMGVIKIGNYNRLGIDRTLWYSVDHAGLRKVEQTAKCQNDTIDNVKLTPPLPETTCSKTTKEVIDMEEQAPPPKAAIKKQQQHNDQQLVSTVPSSHRPRQGVTGFNSSYENIDGLDAGSSLPDETEAPNAAAAFYKAEGGRSSSPNVRSDAIAKMREMCAKPAAPPIENSVSKRLEHGRMSTVVSRHGAPRTMKDIVLELANRGLIPQGSEDGRTKEKVG